MDEQVETREVYVDFLSNQPKNEISRQNAADRLRWQLAMRLDASIDRGFELPSLIVNNPDGEYLALLLEARQLYIDGYFYACVAMCGIVNERLIKDTLHAAKDLGDLRNKYAHARGRQSKNDALNAIKLLQEVVEGTVSVLKDHEIKDGKFVRKNVDAA